MPRIEIVERENNNPRKYNRISVLAPSPVSIHLRTAYDAL